MYVGLFPFTFRFNQSADGDLFNRKSACRRPNAIRIGFVSALHTSKKDTRPPSAAPLKGLALLRL